MADKPKALERAKQDVEGRHQEGGPFVQAVDATSMAMVVTDCRLPGNPIIFVNAAFLALSGYEPDEIIGKNYTILYGSRTEPETARKVDEALNAKGDIALEVLLCRKDGRYLWVYQHVCVQVEDGEVRRHFASFWDIDRRVRAEREVRRAHQLLEQRVAKRTRDLSRAVEDMRRENAKRLAAEDVLRNTLNDKDLLIRQRDFLVKEVNHRVKNTLQMASALLSVQAGTTQDQSVSGALRAAVGRLDRLAEVHKLLYDSAETASGISLDTYLTDLCDHLMVASEGGTSGIGLTVEVEEGFWSTDMAIPIALIVNEAVTNALKHGFPGNRGGSISVRLRHVGDNFHELVITDDGVGWDGGGDGPRRPGSLGMTLIDTFARQLRGKLQIDREGGTTVTVRFLHPEEERSVIAE